jgi:hypothetical protein
LTPPGARRAQKSGIWGSATPQLRRRLDRPSLSSTRCQRGRRARAPIPDRLGFPAVGQTDSSDEGGMAPIPPSEPPPTADPIRARRRMAPPISTSTAELDVSGVSCAVRTPSGGIVTAKPRPSFASEGKTYRRRNVAERGESPRAAHSYALPQTTASARLDRHRLDTDVDGAV